MTHDICAIVLAAGQGSRFEAITGHGHSKLLARCVGRDAVERSVLENTLVSLQGLVSKVLLVTRPDCPEIIALARHYHCDLLSLVSAGMGDSIAAAVAAEPGHAGWLIVLGDMPFILPETLHIVATSLKDDSISVPVFQGEFGHPVAFGKQYGPALAQLTGDQGARRLFKEACVQQIEVDDPGVLWDVDVPQRLVFTP